MTLSKREQFSAVFLQGLLSNPHMLAAHPDQDLVETAVFFADKLIEKLNPPVTEVVVPLKVVESDVQV